MSVNINLELQEVQAVMNAIGKEPFSQVADLWFKIKSQAEAQLAAEQEAKKPEEPAPQGDQA